MNSIIKNIAREYRDRAEESRTRAALAPDEQTRNSLPQIADTWERMAAYEESTNPQRHLWGRKPQAE